MDLRSYSPQQVAHMARPGGPSAADVVGLPFRDPSGRFWTVGPGGDSWWIFGQSGWQNVAAPATRLEGRALDELSPTPLPAQADAAPQTPADATARAIVRARLLYEIGALTSTQVESLLRNLFMVDVQGRAWTGGVRSGAWYYHQAGAWNQWTAPPETATIADARQPFPPNSPAGAVLMDFFSRGFGSLPEPLTDPWNPPPPAAPQP